MPPKASEVGCLLSHDFRCGFLYNPTGSKQKNCSPSVVYIFAYAESQNRRILFVGRFQVFFTERDERPMVY